jgi:hypothetical protein
MSSIRRTAQGKLVDINALRLKNERVRAVGNMNVNAKGDVVDADNRPISSRKRQVDGQYRKQITTNVQHSEVATQAPPARPAKTEKSDAAPKKAAAKPVTRAARPKPEPIKVDMPEDFEDDEIEESRATTPEPRVQGGGLGAALQRAREIRGENAPADNNKPAGIIKI